MSNRLQLGRSLYQAFTTDDRRFIEDHLTDDFVFSSPLEVGLDRTEYFERCWPGAGTNQQFELVRLIEHGNEVVVTIEMVKPDGSRGRNVEVLTFKGDKIANEEVYFGWTYSKEIVPSA